MKTLITSVILVAVFTGLSTGKVQAQVVFKPSKAAKDLATAPEPSKGAVDSPVQGKVLNKDIIMKPSKPPADSPVQEKVRGKDIITRPTKGPADNSRLKNVKLAAGVHIKQFTAKRESGRIAITAVLSTAADKAIDNVTYRISRMEGGRWISVASGTVAVPAGSTRDVSSTMGPTNDEVRLKIDVVQEKPYAYSTKPFNLKARIVNFVVRYGTNGDWVLAYEDKNDLSDGFDASELARTELRPRGLETRVRKTKTTGLDSPFSIATRIHTELYVRTADKLEKTFEDRSEAEAFRQKLISLVKDKRLTVESVHEQE